MKLIHCAQMDLSLELDISKFSEMDNMFVQVLFNNIQGPIGGIW